MQGGFTPVLAIGSNAAPSQLFRKYCGGEPSWPQLDVAVPCVRLGLVDYDVVYCPLLSSYGSIPATLQVGTKPMHGTRTHGKRNMPSRLRTHEDQKRAKAHAEARASAPDRSLGRVPSRAAPARWRTSGSRS